MSNETPSNQLPANRPQSSMDFSGLAGVLSAVINISDTGIYHEPSCPVCSSSKRQESETMWRGLDPLDPGRADKMVAYFQGVGETISRDAVRNHFKSHMDQGDVELRKAEYISRLSNLTMSGISTIDHLKIAMAAVMECMTWAGSVTADKYTNNVKALEVKSKMVTSLVKTWVDLLSLQAKMLGEMQESGDLVTMPKSAFIKVFDDALKTAKSKEESMLIQSILNGLQSALQQ